MDKEANRKHVRSRGLAGKTDCSYIRISRNKKYMSNGTILVALKRMGYKNKMTGHGFRSLAMGVLKEKLRYSHELVDKQLNHEKRGTNKAYDRAGYLPQRTEMMQEYASYLDEVFTKEECTRIINRKAAVPSHHSMFSSAYVGT